MARLFWAIEVSTAVRAELERAHAGLARRLGDGVRLTNSEQLHLALIFLGEIDLALIADVRDAALSATRASPFGVTLGAPGAFPESGPATVLWVGISDPTGGLLSLAGSLAAALRHRGFPIEDRPFVTHLTLGRCKDGSPKAREVLTELRIAPLPLRVEKITLFRSERGPQGTRHVPLEVLQLGSEGSR
jgi:2'-5' RNA ligase